MPQDFDLDELDKRLAAKEGASLDAAALDDLDKRLEQKERVQKQRAGYVPPESQEERMAPPFGRHAGARLATLPGYELLAEPAMAAADKALGTDSRTTVDQTATELAENDPEMAYRMRRRGKMAKADLPGRVIAGAGAAEAALPYAFAPLAPGTNILLAGAGATEPGRKVLSAPAEGAGALARMAGAEEGGAAEALARLGGTGGLLALSRAAAKRAGARPSATAHPVAEAYAAPTVRGGLSALSRAAREGGPRAFLTPQAGAEAASLYAGMGLNEAGRDLGTVIGADPEGGTAAALNLGTALGGNLVQAKVEGDALKAGQLSLLKRLQGERQATRTARHEGARAAAEAQAAEARAEADRAAARRRAENEKARAVEALEPVPDALDRLEDRRVVRGVEESMRRLPKPSAPAEVPEDGAIVSFTQSDGTEVRGKAERTPAGGMGVRIPGRRTLVPLPKDAEVIWSPGDTPGTEPPAEAPRRGPIPPEPDAIPNPKPREARMGPEDKAIRASNLRQPGIAPEPIPDADPALLRAVDEVFAQPEEPAAAPEGAPAPEAAKTTDPLLEAMEEALAELRKPAGRVVEVRRRESTPDVLAADAAARWDAMDPAARKALPWPEYADGEQIAERRFERLDEIQQEIAAEAMAAARSPEDAAPPAAKSGRAPADTPATDPALAAAMEEAFGGSRVPAEAPPAPGAKKPPALPEAPAGASAPKEPLPNEIISLKRAWGRPAAAEGTVPTAAERALAGRAIADLAAEASEATGRTIRAFKAPDGSEFLYDAAQVTPAEMARRAKAGTLWEVVGGTAKKPAAPVEAVVTRDPETGREVRTVLSSSPEETAAAEGAAPKGFPTKRIPATEESLRGVLGERMSSDAPKPDPWDTDGPTLTRSRAADLARPNVGDDADIPRALVDAGTKAEDVASRAEAIEASHREGYSYTDIDSGRDIGDESWVEIVDLGDGRYAVDVGFADGPPSRVPGTFDLKGAARRAAIEHLKFQNDIPSAFDDVGQLGSSVEPQGAVKAEAPADGSTVGRLVERDGKQYRITKGPMTSPFFKGDYYVAQGADGSSSAIFTAKELGIPESAADPMDAVADEFAALDEPARKKFRDDILRQINEASRAHAALDKGGADPSPMQDQMWDSKIRPLIEKVRVIDSVAGRPNESPEVALDRIMDDAEALTAERVLQIRPEGTPPKPPRVQRPRVLGAETEVTTTSPNEEIARVPARYALVESSDVIPSHDIKESGFSPREDYPQEIQPRRYEADPIAGQATREYLSKFDPQQVVNTAPGATDGPPTIDADGVVLNGNGRAMIVREILRKGGKPADAYRAAIAKQAEAFGISPEAIEGMEAPILVRIADLPPEAHAEFAAAGNISSTKRGSSSAEATKYRQTIPADFILEPFGTEEAAGFAEVINANTEAGRTFRKGLANYVPTADLATFIDPSTGRVTANGQAILRDIALFHAGVPPEAFEAFSPQTKKALEASVPALARLRNMGHGDFVDALVEAATFDRTHVEGRSAGVPEEAAVAEALQQGKLLGDGPKLDATGRMLVDFVTKKKGAPAQFGKALNEIADVFADGGAKQGRMFAPPGGDNGLIAEALGVPLREGADFRKVKDRVIYLGAGPGALLGAAQGTRVAGMAKALIGALGGAAYANATEQDEWSDYALYSALGAMAGYAHGRGARGTKLDIGRAVKAAQANPFTRPAMDAVEKVFRYAPARIGPAFAETIRTARRERMLGEYRAMQKAGALPNLTPEHRLVAYRFIGGEKGSDAEFARLLDEVNPSMRDDLKKAAENIKRTVSRMADEAVELGRLSPEARDEYAQGWLQRIYLNDFMKDATVYRKFKSDKPTVVENRIRADGYGEVLALPAETVAELVRQAGVPDPTIILQKGDSTLVKWEDSPDGQAARDAFDLALSDYARGAARMKVGAGKKGGIGHLAARDGSSFKVDLSRQAIGKILDEAGIAGDVTAPPTGSRRFGVKFKDAAAADAFEAALRQKAEADATFAAGEGASGGTGHLIKKKFDPLTLAQREELGETFDPKASTELTLARMAWQNANARTMRSIRTLKDENGAYSVEAPKGARPGSTFEKGGVEYTVAPDAYSWHELKGRGVRSDAFEYLNSASADAGATGKFLEGFLSKWKGAKILTPLGLMKNVWSNLMWYGPAMGIDVLASPVESVKYLGRAARMLKDKKGIARVLKEVGADPHIGDRTDFLGEGSEEVYQMMRRGSTTPDAARTMGEKFGDIFTGGATANSAMLRAVLGAGVGAAGADDGEGLAGALYGAGMGAASGPLMKRLRGIYSSVDPLFKTAAYLRMRDKGFSKKAARTEVQKFSQVFDEAAPFTRWAQGKQGGMAGATGLLLGNPFVSFRVENARILGNLAKEKPGLFANLMLRKEMMILAGLGVMAAAGDEGVEGTTEGAAAMRKAYPGSALVPIRGEDGRVRVLDLAQMFPGTDDALGVQEILSSPKKAEAIRDEGTKWLGSGPFMTGLHRTTSMLADADSKDFRTGMPFRRRGESALEAFSRRTAEDLTSPMTPGVGTQFRRLKDTGILPGLSGKEFEDRVVREERDAGAQLLDLGTGLRTRKLDFGAVQRSISGEARARLMELEERFRRDMKDPNLSPERRQRLADRYRRDMDDAVEVYRGRSDRELPRRIEVE